MTPDHTMKSWPAFFQAIKSGHKKHDVRSIADRDFKVGQLALLQEYDPFRGVYTGDELMVQISFITSRETPCALSSVVLDRDYAILSLDVIN